jgi:hypothetical protein
MTLGRREFRARRNARHGTTAVHNVPPIPHTIPSGHHSQPPSPAGTNRAMRRLQAKQARRKL